MQSSAISIAPPISPFNKPRLNPNSLRLTSSKRFNIVNCNNTCGFNLSRRIDGLFSLKLKSKNDFVVVRASSAMAESGGEGGEVQKEKVKDEFVVRASSAMAEGGEGSEVKKEKVKDEFVVRASSAMAESADNGGGEVAKEKANAFGKTLELGILFGLWYLFNIYFNIYNKQVLKVYQFPVTVTLCQFFVGAVLVCIMWTFNFYRPKVSAGQLAAILPLAIVHTLGNLFTNMSLGKVAVSFTHTIKAMEPFFSVLLSAAFLGETPTTPIILSLLPIVGGVALASVTEASFNWAGFWSAMASNLTNQSRNVLSKKVMVNKEESLDNITLFSIITVMSFVLLAPATIFMEGVKFTPGYLEAAGLNVQQVYVRSLLAALCFHAYQQVSYMILQKVSPVTHSVGNCVKRVVVITSSVIFFKTPVSPINALGTGIALAGVFLYSRVKRLKAKPKAA